LNRKKPLVSFTVNTYNRIVFLRNLVLSLEKCNKYPNIELIITDYGSKDGSREFIIYFAKQADFDVKYILSDEAKYFESIRNRGLTIDSNWARTAAIFGKSRNEARELAKGEYFIDLADDQQFIREGNWIEELFEIFDHRKNKIGKDDISCIVTYAYFRWRLDKPNNTRLPEQNSEKVQYYVAKEKDYVDYHCMKNVTYTRIGQYSDPIMFKKESKEWEMWNNEDPMIRPEQEYQSRCSLLDLKRVFMKYPILVAFPNTMPNDLITSDTPFIAPIWSLDEMKLQFSKLNRPISSDELDPTHKVSLFEENIHQQSLAARLLAKIYALK